MAFFRQYVAPLIAVLFFLVALVATSARIFLPADMAAPAPVEEVGFHPASGTVAELPDSLSILIRGVPDDPALSAPF